MSRFEFHIGEELLELIATNIGERGLKAFVKDFAEWADFVLEDDDEEYLDENGDTQYGDGIPDKKISSENLVKEIEEKVREKLSSRNSSNIIARG